MFTSEAIKARVKQQPFRPVRFVMSSGESHDVDHPDLVMVGRHDVMVGTAGKRDPTTYDQVTRLSILHIAEMRDLALPKPPKQNGKGR